MDNLRYIPGNHISVPTTKRRRWIRQSCALLLLLISFAPWIIYMVWLAWLWLHSSLDIYYRIGRIHPNPVVVWSVILGSIGWPIFFGLLSWAIDDR